MPRPSIQTQALKYINYPVKPFVLQKGKTLLFLEQMAAPPSSNSEAAVAKSGSAQLVPKHSDHSSEALCPMSGASLQARKKLFISVLAAGGQGNASSFPQAEHLSPWPGVCGMGMQQQGYKKPLPFGPIPRRLPTHDSLW